MLMMADVGFCFNRTATLSIIILEKMLMVNEEVDIGTRPDTLPTTTQVTMLDCYVYLLLLVVFTKVFMTMKDVIPGLMMEDVALFHKRPVTLTFTITEKVLTVMGEVDIGLRLSPLPPII